MSLPLDLPGFLQSQDLLTLLPLMGGILLATWLLYRLSFRLLQRLFRSHLWVLIKSRCYYPGLLTLVVLVVLMCLPLMTDIAPRVIAILDKVFTILLIASITFLLIRGLAVVKAILFRRFDIHSENNLQARKVYTQFQILERVLIFLLIILAVSVSLMTFDSIRQVGVSLLASAGVLGIILGFAAQKSFSTIFAGIQIAIAQPIRLDDVVVLEGEWGRIEEIMLTYITVRLWDNRRLIVPVNYFLDKPFQNWTRMSAEITGTVYLYADYAMPMEPLREELDRLLDGHPLWDGQVKALQVTDATERGMQIRVLVSADTSSKAWDLRCDVREKLIFFMQQKYPAYLPTNRLAWEKPSSEGEFIARPPKREEMN